MGETSRGRSRRRHRHGERSTRSTISLALAAATLALLATTIALPVFPGASSDSSVAFAADAQVPKTSATAALSFNLENQDLFGSGTSSSFNEELFEVRPEWRPDIDAAPAFEFAADFESWLQFGFYGGARVSGGSVDVSYPTRATAQALRPDGGSFVGVGTNDKFVLRTSDVAQAPTMSTDFAEVSAEVGIWGNVGVGVNVYASAFTECFVCNEGGFFHTDFRQELLGAGLADGALSLRAFGIDIPTPDDGIELRSFLPSPFNEFVSKFRLSVPNLDTGPANSRWDGEVITNRLLPLTRPDDSPTDVDVLTFGADLDAIAGHIGSKGSWSKGAKFDVVPGIIGIEIVDLDLDSFWGIDHTVTFDPNMHAVFTFSEPALVERFPGAGTFTLAQTWTAPVGSDVTVVHPGGDFTVDVDYTLNGTGCRALPGQGGCRNMLNNDVDLVADLALTPRVLCLAFKGVVGNYVDDECFYEKTYATGYAPIADINGPYGSSRSLFGFADQSGGQLVLPAVDPPLMSATVEMDNTRTATLSGRITDPNAGETFTLELYWDNLTQYQPLQFGTTPIDSGGVRWNPSTGEYSVEHTYPSGSATQTYDILVAAIDSTFQSSGARRMSTTFVDPPPRLDVLDFSFPNLSVKPDGHRVLTANGYIDDGNLGDTFTLELEWRDPDGTSTTQVIDLGTVPIDDPVRGILWEPYGDCNGATLCRDKYFEIRYKASGDDSGDVVLVEGNVTDSYGQSSSDAKATSMPSPRWLDDIAPTVAITVPADGGVYLRDESVLAEFACTDERYGSGIDSCVAAIAGGIAIDTSTVGTKTFTVTAVDGANTRLGGGRSTAITHSYTVVDDPVTAANDSVEGGIGLTTTFDVSANDLGVPTGSTYRLSGTDTVVGTPTIDARTGRISYKPVAGDYGLLSIGYQVCPPVAAADESNCDTAELDISVPYKERSSAGSDSVTVDPARLLDTRANGESIDGRFVAAGKLGAGQITRVKVAGRGGVPADASGVELNLTAIGADRKGFATLYPCTSPPPTASTLNFYQGVNIANASTVALNAAGEVCIFTSSPAQFALDVVAFFPAGSQVSTVDPARLLDTRANGESIDGRFVAAGKLGAGQITRVKVAGRGGVPADASGVELNLTAIGADRKGFATLYPCTSPPPTASTLNFYQGVNIANASTVALNAAGEVCIFTSSPAQFALDVVAFFPAGSQVSTVDPARLLDTRANGESIDGRFVAAGKLGAGQITRVKVAGRGGVPADASGVELNLTAIGADRKGFATLYPCTSPPPTASTLNFYQGVNIANASTVALNAAGEVCIFTSSPAHFAIDVVGFVAGGA